MKRVTERITAVWLIAGLLLGTVTCIFWAVRTIDAYARVEERVSEVTWLARHSPGKDVHSVVEAYLSSHVPNSDELLAGMIDGEVIHMTGAGLEYPPPPSTLLHVERVAVVASDGSRGEILAGVDMEHQAQKDRLALAALAIIVVLVAGTLTCALAAGAGTGSRDE
ncbi:hypothetical protein [Corynebacterium uterequi]|uniref:Uncharacterized protein n=1 Tax=Corynebacterium uterequi TaxID=1072256 RepID=A0A0G3HEC3_9CORY|nr:hypothetical protein [Corynebacterium uterequi]AKK11671.1 hypothetical protein CUTER_08440 [Corynebacterium uterequi]